MIPTDRRQFLRVALAAGSGAALSFRETQAIEPIKRSGKSHLRLSIAGYSYRKYLDLKKKEMTYDDFIDTAAAMGTDAVELTQYYFPETTPEYLASLKGRATRLGLDVSGTAIGNIFSLHRPGQAQGRRSTWSKSGSNTPRGWAARPSASSPATWRRATPRKRPAAAASRRFRSRCDHAGKYGIYLALENHGGIVATIDQMLAVVKAVKHDWFGVNFDTGNFHSPDPYADLTKLAPYAVVCQIKTEIQRTGMKKEQADLKRLTDILRDADFRGYVALEYEARGSPKTGVPNAIEKLKKLMG